MIVRNRAVEKAEAALEAEGDVEPREALTELLTAYRRLQNSYNYLTATGEPDPWPPAGPLHQEDGLEALADRWRGEAETLKSHGADSQASTLEDCATDLDVALRVFRQEKLNLRQAAAWSGYSRQRLREMVHEGKLPDNRPAGSQGTIKVRRCDLPRKPVGDRDTVSPSDLPYTRFGR